MWPWLIAGVTGVCGIALALLPIDAQGAFGAAAAGRPLSQVSGVSLNPMSTTGAVSLATWEKASAVAKAKEYLSLMAFSETGVIGQLEYAGFTSEQAVYGVDNA